MRILITSALATAMLFVSAATASAVSFSLNIVAGAATPGSPLTLDLVVDGEADQLQAWFMQVDHAGNTASAATIAPFIFHGGAPATPLGAPVINGAAGGNATGQFAMSINPPGFIAPGSGPVVFGQISFAAVSPGTIAINISEAGGAVVGAGGAILPYTTTGITIVPEPTTALLVGLGLVGLGVAGRRK